MDDPRTWWLNLTNIALGVGVLVFLLIVVGAAVSEFLKGRPQKA